MNYGTYTQALDTSWMIGAGTNADTGRRHREELQTVIDTRDWPTFRRLWIGARTDLTTLESLLVTHAGEQTVCCSTHVYNDQLIRDKVEIIQEKIDMILAHDHGAKLDHLDAELTGNGIEDQFGLLNLYESLGRIGETVLRVDMDGVLVLIDRLVPKGRVKRARCVIL